MKKFLRITAALAAVFAMVNFVACKDDDDDDDDGNGFENTYWVLEDDVDEEEGYIVSAEQYVYIKDSSTGTMYGADSEQVWEAVDDLVGAGVTDSKTFEYTQKTDFTYVIEGSTIKITYKDEAGKAVDVTVTVAEDKNSFSLTDKDEDGEPYTMTYKKAPAAPKAATVTYTAKTTESVTPADPVTYSFENGISAEDVTSVGLVYDSAKKVYNTPLASELTEKVLTSGATIGWKGSKSVGTLRFRAETEDPTVVTALNYNGGSVDSILTSCGTPDRYVKVPVKANQTITVTYKVVTSSSATGDIGQIGLFDDSGAVVGTVTEGLKLKNGDGSKETLTATATADGNVKVVFSRNGAGGGGVDIYSIVVE